MSDTNEGKSFVRKSLRDRRMEKDEEELAKLEEELKASDTEKTGQDDLPAPAKTLEEQTWQKRYGDLRSYSEDKYKTYEQRISALEDRLKSTSNFAAPASDEDIDTWKNKYPEASNIIETLAKKIADEKFSQAKLSIDDLEEIKFENKRQKGLQVIKKSHPDFDDITADAKFLDWVDKQPKKIQEALYDNIEDTDSVIWVLDKYKESNPQRRKQQEKEAASDVRVSSGGKPDALAGSLRFSESMVNKMSLKEYNKYEAQIDEAIRTGNFDYDMTASARN